MKVYILGKGKDDKGTQLEELTTQILEHQGFSSIHRNIQVAGGNELDVCAAKIDNTGVKEIKTPVICECKAHNTPIDMNDWLKFIGKLYIERKKSSSTIGLMISLFGAKGTVLGSYSNDFSDDDRVQLIVNDDLFSILSDLYAIDSLPKIKDTLQANHQIQCWDIDVLYFQKKCYLVVSLGENSEYTICDTSGKLLKYSEVTDILSVIDEWTPFTTEKYIDIWSREETEKLCRVIEGNILTCLFVLGDMNINEVQKHILYSADKTQVPMSLIKEAAINSKYVNYNDSTETLTMNEIDDSIEFINYIYSIEFPTDLFSSRKFQDLLSMDLIEKIKLLQFGIELSEEESEKCLFVIRHSPSALFYVVNPDRFFHQYRTSIQMNPNLKSVLHNHFFRQLIKSFEEDFCNNEYHKLMIDGFASVNLHTKSVISAKTDTEEKQINFEESLSLLPLEGFQQPILLSSIIEKDSTEK